MKLRSLFFLLIASVLVLLLISASGFYWLTARSPLKLINGGSTATPTTAIFVSKQAPVMLSLLVNPDRLEALPQLLTPPGQRRRSRAEFNQLKQSFLASTHLDYQRDIQPWLGDEIGFAVTTPDLDRNSQNGLQPGYLLVATSKNSAKSRQFLDLFWQKQALASTNLVFEQYKGVKLIYGKPKPILGENPNERLPNHLVSAVVGDRFVVFANDPKVLREAINNVQVPSLSLNENTEYQLALEKLTQPHLGLTFVNLPSIEAWLGNKPSTTGQFDSLAIALGLNRQGLLAETALLPTPDRTLTTTPPTLTQPVAALEYLPASSALAVAGTDLNQLWNQISQGLPEDNTFSTLIKQSLGSLETALGINVPQNIFSWVQGEYALAMLPRPDRQYPDWIFVAEKSDDAIFSESIERLDSIAKDRGFSVGALPLGERSIIGWTKLVTAPVNVANKNKTIVKLEAQVEGVHTSVGKYEIFATSVEALDRALKGGNNSLLKSSKLKDAIAPLPQSNNGYLYIDWQSSQPILERQFPVFQVVELIGKPFFTHLRSLSATHYGNDNGVQRSRAFFRLNAQ